MSELDMLALLFADLKQKGFGKPVQRLTIKCKTAKARDEISNAFDLFRVNLSIKKSNANFVLPSENKSFSVVPIPTEQDRINGEVAFRVIKGEEDNSFNVYVRDENRVFDLLSFIEPFLGGIVSASMSGVNKFKQHIS